MLPSDIKQIRQSKGMTQQEFADFILVGLSSLQAWEQGRRRVKPLIAQKIRASRLRKHDPDENIVQVGAGEKITIIGV